MGSPVAVPPIRTLDTLDLAVPVTFFVGEHGCGKRTLLAGIATPAGLPTLGHAPDVRQDA